MSAARNPIPMPQSSASPQRLLPEDSEQVLPDSLANVAWWLGQTEAQLELLSSRFVSIQRSLVRRIRTRISQIKDEQPMPLLGAIAGSAFVAGVALRLWQSRRA